MNEEGPKVNLIGVTRGDVEAEDGNYIAGPEEFSGAGALGCFEEKSSKELMEEWSSLSDKERKEKIDPILKNSAGRGHGSVLDQNHFIFSIEDLTRGTTFQLCSPEYLIHLQQSLRRANADRGFHISEEIQGRERDYVDGILSESFELYEDMVGDEEDDIPMEDARFVLPLSTKTNIQTAGNARALMHLYKMTNNGDTPNVVQSTVNEMMNKAKGEAENLFEDTGYNYETLGYRPSTQFYIENKTLNAILEDEDFPDDVLLLDYSGIDIDDETMERAVRDRNEGDLSALKHINFEFLIPNSLVTRHQMIRQSTTHNSGECVYDAAERGEIVVPPSIQGTKYENDFKRQNGRMVELYHDLKDEVPRSEVVSVNPHALQSYDMIHIDGWNALHFIGKRRCTESQWEIREKAEDVAKEIKNKNPSLGKFSEPQCIVYRKCPEPEECGYLENYKEKHSPD